MTKKQLREAINDRLDDLAYDKIVIKKRIRRARTRKGIQSMRKILNLIEASERALDSE